jgi:hypothetical protein
MREVVTHAAFRFTRDKELAQRAREGLGYPVGDEREVDGAPAWVYRPPGRGHLADVPALRNISRKMRREPRRGIPLAEDELRDVADTYTAALAAAIAEGKRPEPTKAVMQQWHLTRPTASRWIAKARQAGALGPAKRGRASA